MFEGFGNPTPVARTEGATEWLAQECGFYRPTGAGVNQKNVGYFLRFFCDADFFIRGLKIEAKCEDLLLRSGAGVEKPA